jgi:hypothetical protein
MFQKNVLLWPKGGPVGMDVPVYPLNDRSYKFHVLDRSVSFQSG